MIVVPRHCSILVRHRKLLLQTASLHVVKVSLHYSWVDRRRQEALNRVTAVRSTRHWSGKVAISCTVITHRIAVLSRTCVPPGVNGGPVDWLLKRNPGIWKAREGTWGWRHVDIGGRW